MALKNVQEMDKIDSKEKQKILSLADELEDEKKRHRISIRKLKQDIKQLEPGPHVIL